MNKSVKNVFCSTAGLMRDRHLGPLWRIPAFVIRPDPTLPTTRRVTCLTCLYPSKTDDWVWLLSVARDVAGRYEGTKGHRTEFCMGSGQQLPGCGRL